MPIEFHGKLVITDGGIVFVPSGGIQPYDTQYLARQLCKCDVYFEAYTYELAGVRPNIVFPFVRKLSDEGAS